MNGNLNGIQLQILSRSIFETNLGARLISLRILKRAVDLEKSVHLDDPACLIVSDEIIEGKVVHFSKDDQQLGYEITIEVPRTIKVE